jgi:hypothetical protein
MGDATDVNGRSIYFVQTFFLYLAIKRKENQQQLLYVFFFFDWLDLDNTNFGKISTALDRLFSISTPAELWWATVREKHQKKKKKIFSFRFWYYI